VVSDSGYIREATSANLLEVRLGTLAGQRSSNSAVKQFGQQMVSSHSSMGQQWASLASKNGLPTSATLNSIQQQSADQLSKLSGAEFDRAYMQAMVEDHEQDAGTLQRIGAAAQSAEVRELAASGLATTQEHLRQAQAVAGQVGAPAGVATTSPSSPASPTNAGGRRRTVAGKGDQADGRYAQELAYGHIMEVRLAQLAQKRAKNKEVKQFADRVADDFGKWRDRWTDLASKHGGVKVNPNMGPLHQQKIDRLEKASSRNFDQVYLDIVVENLGSMVPYMEKEGRAAGSADIRSAVNDELPNVREKLSAAQRLDRQVQVSGKE
jgi:putative membrane protein